MSAIEVYEHGPVVAVEEWTRERIDLVKRTYCKGASDDEFALFLGTCQRTGLSPEARQIFAVKRRENVNGSWVEVMSTQTSIDGYRLIAQRSNAYAGQVPKQWCGEDGEWRDVWLSSTPPAAARAGVYRRGFAEPLIAVATYSEYVQTKKDGSPTQMWATKPALMLAKCAEALALRAAFPAELSGLYTQEEMGQADNGLPIPEPASRGAMTHTRTRETDVVVDTGELPPSTGTRKRKPPTAAAAPEPEDAEVVDDPPATPQQIKDIAHRLESLLPADKPKVMAVWKERRLPMFYLAPAHEKNVNPEFTAIHAASALALLTEYGPSTPTLDEAS